MSVQLQVEQTPDYLAVRFTGPAKEAWREFASIAGDCMRANKNKLLLDFTQAQGKLSLIDRYQMGAKAEIFMLFKLMKVAVIGRPEQLDYKRFGEMVARNRWVNARLFINVEAAEAWLLE
jgi:hypothetical protein